MENSKLEELLNLIDSTVQQSYSIKLWVPSLLNTSTEYLMFKPLNISQQKKLMSTSLEEDVQNTAFCKEFYNIIVENYIKDENNFNIFNLTIIDKILIALAIRANTANIYTVNDFSVNLTDLIEKIKIEICNNTDLLSSQIFTYHDNISIKCSVPSIKTEFDSEYLKSPLSLKDAESKITNIIIDTVSAEISKYTNTISINNNEYDLETFSFSERKDILDKIPAGALEQVLNYIISTKQFIEKLLTVNLSEDTTEALQINGSFFATL